MYLKALCCTHEFLDKWHVLDRHVDVTFLYLSDLYVTMNKREDMSFATGTRSETNPPFLEGLLGLLNLSGFREQRHPLLPEGSICVPALKNNFQSREGSKRALLSATKSADVQSFRPAILSCCKSNFPHRLIFRDEPTTKKELEKIVKERTRKIVLNDAIDKAARKSCSKPSCTVTETASSNSILVVIKLSGIVQGHVRSVIGLKEGTNVHLSKAMAASPPGKKRT
jgi:hypothetical protein